MLPAGGVIVFGEKLTATPEGWPLDDRVTEEVKPFIEVTATVAVVELPALMLTLEGDTLMLKSPLEMT